jgi:hypothetical protein
MLKHLAIRIIKIIFAFIFSPFVILLFLSWWLKDNLKGMVDVFTGNY